MQVESVPASTTPTEVPVPSTPVPATSSEPSESVNAPAVPASDETDPTTFHVMQPPESISVASSEIPIVPTPTPPTYAQLIAVPIASDQPIVAATSTPTAKPAKRVRIIDFSQYFNTQVHSLGFSSISC